MNNELFKMKVSLYVRTLNFKLFIYYLIINTFFDLINENGIEITSNL